MGGGSCSAGLFWSVDFLSIAAASALFFGSLLNGGATGVETSIFTELFLTVSAFFSLEDSSGGITQDALEVSCEPFSSDLASATSLTSLTSWIGSRVAPVLAIL